MIELLARVFIKNRENKMNEKVRIAYGTLCGAVGVFFNLLLFTAKFIAGTVSGSMAVTADAFNNLSDAASSMITVVGFQISGKKADAEHPFGHGRFEYILGLLISMIIIFMGFQLGSASIAKIRQPEPVSVGLLSVVVMSASILVKAYMAFYNYSIGRKINSEAMKAVQYDSLSDCAATATALLALLLTPITGLNLDGFGGLLVSGFIIYTGLRSASDTISPLLGEKPDSTLVADIERIVLLQDEIVGIHDLVIHDYGPGRRMVSLHGEVPGDGNMFVLHDAIDRAEREIEDKLGCEAVIHMDPIAVGDEFTEKLRSEVEEKVKAIDVAITIHDFRCVPGTTHTNIIFDAVIPQECALNDEAVLRRLEDIVYNMGGREDIGETYPVVRLDHSYM